MSIVTAILLCRRIAIATRGCASRATSRLAQVRRVECTGMTDTPDRRTPDREGSDGGVEDAPAVQLPLGRTPETARQLGGYAGGRASQSQRCVLTQSSSPSSGRDRAQTGAVYVFQPKCTSDPEGCLRSR